MKLKFQVLVINQQVKTDSNYGVGLVHSFYPLLNGEVHLKVFKIKWLIMNLISL